MSTFQIRQERDRRFSFLQSLRDSFCNALVVGNSTQPTPQSKQKFFKPPSKKFLFLTQSYIYLNILDLILTWVVINLGGKETNPTLLFMNTEGITLTAIVLKTVVPILLVFLTYILYRYAILKNSKISVILVYGMLVSINFFYMLVVWNNIRVIGWQIQEFKRRYG